MATLDSLAGGYADRERIVMFVTDGQVGSEDALLQELAPRFRNARMFTLGVDQAVNAAFLRRLAAAGGGLCELVESEDRLDAVMAKMHRRISTPIATELVLRATELEIDAASVTPMAQPRKLPDVYAGAPVVVLGRYRGRAPLHAKVELAGTSFGEPFAASVTRGAKSADLAASWARARIRDLEDRYAAGAKELEASIVETSKVFRVLSRFTAFLAIDRAEIANRGGRLQQLVQAVEPVAGAELAKKLRVGPGGGGGVGSIAMPARISMPAPAAPMGAPSPMTMQSRASAASFMRAKLAAPMQPKQGAAPPIDATVYLATLGELGRELAAVTTALALKLVRQRIQQWVEDVLSVGGHEALANAVKAQLARLTLETCTAVAGELATVAGGVVPAAPKGRGFWK